MRERFRKFFGDVVIPEPVHSGLKFTSTQRSPPISLEAIRLLRDARKSRRGYMYDHITNILKLKAILWSSWELSKKPTLTIWFFYLECHCISSPA